MMRRRTRCLCRLACAAIAALLLVACGPVLDTQIKMFREADALLAQGRYEEAIGSYGEFVTHYPASDLADDAYVRIGYVLLHRQDPQRTWPGWSGANYRAARDTFAALLRRYPGSDRTLEARNWVLLLDEYLTLAGERSARLDSVARLLPTTRGSDATHGRLEAQLILEQRRAARLGARADSLEAANRRMAGRNAELSAEVRRIRAETERMRRLLIDLERRSGDL